MSPLELRGELLSRWNEVGLNAIRRNQNLAGGPAAAFEALKLRPLTTEARGGLSSTAALPSLESGNIRPTKGTFAPWTGPCA